MVISVTCDELLALLVEPWYLPAVRSRDQALCPEHRSEEQQFRWNEELSLNSVKSNEYFQRFQTCVSTP